ncbi:hypothetical protein ACFQ08_27360 [Streptosporangium algeriense]|uniref:Uncharacterized protein n=1 Tax=Streptosporangium algeriense TaxID=1682748 RepID=A0ABW3DZY5_9ACTN
MAQVPEARAQSPATAALGLGAVLAVSGPVILTASGVGRQAFGWFCAAPGSAPFTAEGPYALENAPGELLFWSVLLLPVVVIGLLLRGSRRSALAAVAMVGTVLAFGLVTAFLLPGPDPCTGRERAVVPPWPLIVCYPVAMGALLLVARSPLSRRQYGVVLWTGAVAAAAWAAMFHRLTVTSDRFLVVMYGFGEVPDSPWNGLAWWSGDADRIGLPVVLVTSAVAAAAIASTRWGRVVGTVAAAALLLFPLLDIATYIDRRGGDFPTPFADSVRWPLLLAAVLVASATWIPRPRTSWAGTVHLARSLARGQSKIVVIGRTKDLAIVVVIAAAAVWLIASSYAPTR